MSRRQPGSSEDQPLAAQARARAQDAHAAPGDGLAGSAPTRRTSAVDATVGHTARVVRTGRDPGAMTADERLAEVGSILATAHRRLQAVNQNGLALGSDPEPTSPSADEGDGASSATEVA